MGRRTTNTRFGEVGGDIDVTFADIVRALESRSPSFSSMVVRYLGQRDPDENRPEEPSDDDFPELSADAWTLGKLRESVSQGNMWGKTPDEAQAARGAAWNALMAAPHAPPRLKLGDMMIELYKSDDPWSRQSIIHIFSEAKLGWGVWKGFKTVYKLSEEAHDSEMFGVLACRIDLFHNTTGEISGATAKYMRRRAWRYLRFLGQAMPEQFPSFACQVLRHYPQDTSFYRSWIASQVWNHEDLKGSSGGVWFDGPPEKLSKRAYDESWKLSASPLFRLIEDARSDTVCNFAILCLKADFSEELRNLEPAWLVRAAAKELATVDAFVVELLQANPEFHQSKLAKLGLEEMVVNLLRSRNEAVVQYAIDYCNAQSPKIDNEQLLELAEMGGAKLTAFVSARFEKASPKDIGLSLLVRMLGLSGLAKLGKAKFRSGFKTRDIDVETYVLLVTSGRDQRGFIAEFYKSAKTAVPTSHLRAHAEVDGLPGSRLRNLMRELGKRSASEIGVAWIKESLFHSELGHHVQAWLTSGILKGSDLDTDWLKTLVTRPSWRDLALQLLGNTELVASHHIGSGWLLKAAKHSDTRVSEFAHSYLLHNFSPDDFALERDSKDVSVGVDTVFALLGEEASVRRFAASYLLLHHPVLSEQEAGTLGIKPRLKSGDYGLSRLQPLLFDSRLDVRTFACKVARVELLSWKSPELAYDLASSSFRETRVLGSEALLGIGEAKGAATLTPPIKWLDSVRAFAMAESSIKATREIALMLIRRHYSKIGSAEKLSWLMDSPDREVRLFAVRLLWEKHRPLPGPRDEGRQRFDSNATLREFVRTVLFGLPPGRMERRDGGDAAESPQPASVAKRQVIEVVRDMALESAEFAAIVTPVLEEFLLSRAKGEWQSCVAALAQMRAKHPGLQTTLPDAISAQPEDATAAERVV
ncbi:MAG: hypothetical protein JKY56_26170 [Kofleriaceae bacterium]|nr:hypothetical protein [Kofleriaceae bacterium]